MSVPMIDLRDRLGIAKTEQSKVVVRWQRETDEGFEVKFILSVELHSPSLPKPVITTMPMREAEDGIFVLVWPHAGGGERS
jgi:hypothetical protein